MLHRSTFPVFCHGVLAVLLMVNATCFAGGPDPVRSPSPTFLESILATRKGSLDVEWKMTPVVSPLSPNPNLYQIKIISPETRRNVSLLVNDKPAVHISSQTSTFAFDFSNYGQGKVKATLVVFDDLRAGSSSRTVEIKPVPGVSGFSPPDSLPSPSP